MRSKGHFKFNYIINNKEYKVEVPTKIIPPVMTRINPADFDKAPNFSGQNLPGK